MNTKQTYGKSRILPLLSGLFLLATTAAFSSCSDDGEENDVLSILFEKSSVGISVSGSEPAPHQGHHPGKRGFPNRLVRPGGEPAGHRLELGQ